MRQVYHKSRAKTGGFWRQEKFFREYFQKEKLFSGTGNLWENSFEGGEKERAA